MIKLYLQTAESGNQTSIVSSISSGDTDPNETAIDIGKGAKENGEGNVEVYSTQPAIHVAENNPILPTRNQRLRTRGLRSRA